MSDPPEDTEAFTRADKIRGMSDEKFAHLPVTSVVLGGGVNIWVIYRGTFSGIDYGSREGAEHDELE